MESNATGRYLCCRCGLSFPQSNDARLHEWREHIPDQAKKNADGYDHKYLEDVPESAIDPHWLLIYDNHGTNWTHPKEVEGKKRRIMRVLHSSQYTMDIVELREAVLLPAEKKHKSGPELSKDDLRELLTEMVDEDRVIREGDTWGVPDAELLPATA